MVTTVLEKRGYIVDTACDGEEALEKAIATTPDLLITDVMMPNMDGWTLVKVLRGRPATAFVPVIFLTALSSDDDRIRGFRLGADDYLPKPFRFEELDLRVARTLHRTERLDAITRKRAGSSSDTTLGDSGNTNAGPDFSGNLSELGVSSLLVLMDMEKKTGVLKVRCDEQSPGKANIFLKMGRPVTAQFDDDPSLINENAIYTILDWVKGSFTFQAQDVPQTPEIKLNTTAILLEGARRIDERDVI